MSNYLMKELEKVGVPTHYVEELNDRETVVKKVSIIPLEVIIRNVAAGSFSKRLGVAEGTPLKTTILEFCYKDDDLGDPMVNDYHILAMGYATEEELNTIKELTFKINDFLKDFFKKINVDLIDFKIEFGKTSDGKIILADEISPDTCRFWDATTHEKLDKGQIQKRSGQCGRRVSGNDAAHLRIRIKPFSRQGRKRPVKHERRRLYSAGAGRAGRPFSPFREKEKN